MIAWALGAALFAVAMPCEDRNGLLDNEKEKVVRDAVYNGKTLLYSPEERPWDRVLRFPEPLTQLYNQHPQAVLHLLLKIMEGGRPTDSVLAAGYAISLQAGPSVGRVCVENFDEKTFDTLDNDWRTTPRKHWIAKVREAEKKNERNK